MRVSYVGSDGGDFELDRGVGRSSEGGAPQR